MNQTVTIPTSPRRIVEPYLRYDLSALVGTMSEEEYFAFDSRAREKYQLISGKVVKMPGSSPEHNMIQADLQFEVTLILRGMGNSCEVIGSDQKVYVAYRKVFYPDLIVVCGDPHFDHLNALRNPTAVFEVPSPSTERDDRTDKFADYQQIESLQHYILVDQDRVAVTHYEKLENGLWAILGTHTTLGDSLTLALRGGEVDVPLAKIYRRIGFADAGAAI
ncbi:MAG: Uma2 family endonuclease [Armatimonadetes bacterium]|nr:Uma2 family endonuclease [Armatimonadota bacterium]